MARRIVAQPLNL